MGYVGVSMCDLCGKRTEKFSGKLTLFDQRKKYHTYTERSWALCLTCYRKMAATKCKGDLIREDLELKLDEIRAKQPKGIKLIS